MRKLTLDLDSIAVESFDATATGEARAPGTVRAHDAAPAVQTLPLSNCVFSACATCGIYC
ncbi:MAG TPA: hypothetical protein VFJ16_23280 [Longimicrobium sp.]|nr:hypothetical protein [Longimicrobium sp.]